MPRAKKPKKRPTPKIKIKDDKPTRSPLPPERDDAGPSGNGFDDAAKPSATTAKPGDAWPAPVCRRLRHFRNLDREYRRLRGDQFTVRDNALEEMTKLGPKDPKREEWEAAFGRSVREIDRLQKSLRWAGQQLIETIDDADKPELFENVDEKPLPPPSLFDLKPAKGKDSVGGTDGQGGEGDGDDDEDKDDEGGD